MGSRSRPLRRGMGVGRSRCQGILWLSCGTTGVSNRMIGLGKAPESAPVFAGADGRHLSPNAVTKAWPVAMAAIGMPAVTLHSLRHTHASMLINAGLDILTISRRLGHSSPTITLNVYGHLIQAAM